MTNGDFHHRRRGLRILGTGAALPDEALTSADLDQRLGLAPGSVEEATGVKVRYVERGSAAALGARAARQALDAAGLELADVDLIVCSSGTPDQPLPYNAALLHEQLAPARPIPAWDVNASCLGFVAGLDLVATLVEAGRHRTVLMVSSDLASTGLDWSNLGASGIFGDGAAAAVLGPADATDSAVVGSGFATYSEGAHTCEIRGGGSRHAPGRMDEPADVLGLMRFRMDGMGVFRLAARYLPGFVDELLAGCDLTLDELLVVPHQASHHGLAYLRRQFKLRDEQVVDIYADHGNQVSASLPSALHAAVTSGRLARGEHALLLGTGAGLSIGGVVLCY
ncbi:3-oxoacyl-[acyl-carrier-protein] synthase III C-terminal domain-containing protein [Nocardioides speluncae]|uniref:3-oxoacyl-[acyl-carrier-protein] synthase III C-terminal domain-containing protein n=1 Tax=Nocardioides speluncae TaxID=2670337 RepID=UPI000D6A01BD|nr:3-oxoacyl-[acyl-carrier-protein] synthase III C-terminal domain-containing protein [Nocardioides speluncae]